MGVPKLGTVAIRITAEGHASRRWKSARTVDEASRLNWALSDRRANTIHTEVTRIVKGLKPSFPIASAEKGVGSSQPFPTASEDNAAVDRCVLVMVDLVWTVSTVKLKPRPPRQIYAPSTFWELKIADLVGASAGVRGSFLRIKLRNPFTKRELSLAGYIAGGDLAIGPSTFKNKPVNPFKLDKRQLPTGQVGHEVTFETAQMDFEDWINGGTGQWVRLVHSHLKTGITKSLASFLQFLGVDTYPDSLVFDLTKLGLGLSVPEVDVQVQVGWLTPENSPSDFVLTQMSPDVIPSLSTHRFGDGILLSFPTGKSGLQDLTARQRHQLIDYVTLKIHNISALADSFDFEAASP
jgi:hypothetical protein